MLKKDDVKTLIASSLYGFYNEILKNEFTTKEYVDSKALPIIFINDENKTGPKLFPLLPEHNLVFIAGDAQISDSNGNITVIYGLCYSDLQNDGSKLLTEYRTNKSAKINASGILESFEYIDSYIKKITDIFKSAINNKMLTTNQNGDFEWIDIPNTNGLATEEYVNNKLIDITVYLDEDITDTTSTMTYKDEYLAYTFNKLDIASIINGLELKIKVVNNQSDTVGKILTFKDFVYDSTLEAYSAYYNENGNSDTEDKVYITNNNDKTIIVYSTEIMFAGLWKHVKLCRDEDKYVKKTDIHTHANKDVLDTITAEKVAQWDSNTGSGGGTTSGINIVTISQSDYDALETKDPNTLYLITTTNAGEIDTASNDITLSDDLPAGTYTLKYEDENNQPLEGFDEITTLEVQ